jgi:chaperone BCS1
MSQPFRRGYLFYGRPGCGKTATVYAIANYLHHHVYFVKSRIADSNPDILEKALKSIPERSIVFFDDVDVMQCANARKPFNNGDNEPGSDDGNNRQPQNS